MMKKQILCFGDSNTHGFCADPSDCQYPQWGRFSETERWTCLLQEKLGQDYHIIEEGLNGRTTVFSDPLDEGLRGIEYLLPCMKSHKPIDLLVIMLGTNDCKERFSASPTVITLGMERLLTAAKQSLFWGASQGNILLLAPPPIGKDIIHTPVVGSMGVDCVEKSKALGKLYQALARAQACHFFDTASLGDVFNPIDCMHLTQDGHSKLSDSLATVIPTCF